jgi:hypothetical protein
MQFLARIEIHNADLQTYYRLHAAMEAESFSRVITDTNDLKQYKMPLGTYWTDAFSDSWAAFNAARRAVVPIDMNAQILIFGGGQMLFQNCKLYAEHPAAGLHRFSQAEPHATPPKVTQVPAEGGLKSLSRLVGVSNAREGGSDEAEFYELLRTK